MLADFWCWLWGHRSPLGGPATVYCGRCGVFIKAIETSRLENAAPDLLNACELFEKWMLCGQPSPYSDSQILRIVGAAIKKARA